jgi:hypothetical protein
MPSNGFVRDDLSHVIPHVTVLQYQGTYEVKQRPNGAGEYFEAELTMYDGRRVLWRSYVFIDKLVGYCE